MTFLSDAVGRLTPEAEAKLKGWTVSDKDRLKVIKKLEQAGKTYVKRYDDSYTLQLSPYGSLAYVNALTGSVSGFVGCYWRDIEFDKDEPSILDQKLHKIYPSCFHAKMTDEQRLNGVKMLGKIGPYADLSMPSAEGVRVNGKTGKIERWYLGVFWPKEPDFEEGLRIPIHSQIDMLAVMTLDVAIAFTSAKFDRLIDTQRSCRDVWRNAYQKLVDTEGRSYWRQWEQAERVVSMKND